MPQELFRRDELWLLLHFRDAWEAITADDFARLLNAPDCFANYHKENYHVSALIPKAGEAIRRAKAADQWPTAGTTHVYRVVENMIQNRTRS